MDQRERISDFEETIRAAIDGRLMSLWTAVPAIVQYVYSDGTLDAQPAIQDRKLLPSGNYVWFNAPLCMGCPIIFPGGGNFVLTFPIAAGDEVLLLVASRCVDSWWQLGGIQKQQELRVHHLSDGFALVGPRSQPRAISNVSTSTVQLRSLDGTQYIELAAGGVINIAAPGGVNVIGTVTATEEGTFNGHTVSAHRHGGVSTGSGDTSTPTG